MRIVKSKVEPRKPQGTEFHIDNVPWYPAPRKNKPRKASAALAASTTNHQDVDIEYTGGIRMEDVSLAEDKVIDWPMVYILTNEEEAYVGQTKSALHRMEQHSANQEKAAFNEANLI